MNPLDLINSKIKEIKADVQRAVEIAILKETTKFNLSRLATLDTENAEKYVGMVKEID
jgi:hypothetical protein